MASGKGPIKYLTSSIAAQPRGVNRNVELFVTVLRMFSDVWNVMPYIVEGRFRVVKFVLV